MGVIARQSIKGALANYLGVAIGFVTTFFVLTRMLTTEEVGLTRVIVDAATLFACVAQLGTGSSLVRFFPHFKGRADGAFGLAMLASLTGFALFMLAFLAFKGPITAAYVEQSPMVADYLYMLPLMTFFVLYLTVFETGASVLMRITVPKMVREVGIRLMTLAAYLLYGYRVVDLDGFVWLFCGSYGAAMLVGLFYLVKVARENGTGLRRLFAIDWSFVRTQGMWKQMLGYTLTMTLAMLAGNVPLMSSIFIGAKAGLGLTGVYTIAFYIANVVEVPYRSLGAISRPVVAAAVKDGDWAEVNRLGRQVSLHQLMVSSMIFLVIWINLDALFTLIPNGDDYRGGAVVVLLLGAAKMLNSSLSIGTDVLNYSRYYALSTVLAVVLTLSAIGLNSGLVESWGIGGAAAATLLSYAIYYLLLLAYIGWRLRVSLFSAGQLKTLAVIAVGFGMNYVWTLWLTPLFGSGVAALLADALLKTAVIGGGTAAALVAWKVSPTVNAMADGMMKKLKIK